MKQKTLGNSGIQVSNLCLGTMYFGTKVNQKNSFALLDQFVAAGGNFIDTSNNYAFWMDGASGDESEVVLGAWISSRKNRDKLIISTKVGARPTHVGGGLEDMEGLRYATIMAAVEESLRRLRCDYIDLYYAHVDWYDAPLEERLRAFEELSKTGKIRATGASNLHPWRLERSQRLSSKNDWPTSVAVQQKYSYLRPKANADFWVQKCINPEWIDYATQNPGISLIAYSTLLSGAYSRAELPPEYDTQDNQIRLKTITDLAQAKGVTVNQMVLAWMTQGKVPIIPLIAASKTEQLTESLGSNLLTFTEEEIELLDQAGI